MSDKYLVGFDMGTGSVRVGIYRLDGSEVGFGVTEYTTYHEHPGWAEQKPEDWWSCLRDSINKAMKECDVSKDDILAIGYDTTSCSVMLCKEDGEPIRDCLLWMDVRSAKEAEEIAATGDPALKFNGYGNVSPEWMPCKALWLKRNEPENYEAADVVCECADWIAHKLTGRWTASISNISARWYYDQREGGFPKSLYEGIGLADVLDKFPKKICNLGDNIGTLTKEAAQYLGLSENTIVAQGGPDAYIGCLGLGVIEPGKIALITGSSHLILGLTDQYNYSKNGLFGPFPAAIRPEYGMVEGGQISSGSIVSWFKNRFCNDLSSSPLGIYGELNKLASEIPPGSEGLVVLDWWQGNRTPYTDGSIRGNIYGLSLNHTRGHLFRAIMEGVAYGTENVFTSFRNAGYLVDEIYMGGGTTNSDLFMQIHADVSNVVVHVPEDTQSAALGSAILASLAAGVYENVDAAVKAMVSYQKAIKPNLENHKIYQEYFKQYAKAYPTFGKWMQETTKLVSIGNE